MTSGHEPRGALDHGHRVRAVRPQLDDQAAASPDERQDLGDRVILELPGQQVGLDRIAVVGAAERAHVDLAGLETETVPELGECGARLNGTLESDADDVHAVRVRPR